MPIAAPTTALPVQASPAQSEKAGAGGKPDAPDPEFGKLFRAQAGPILGAKPVPAITAASVRTVGRDVALKGAVASASGSPAMTDSAASVAPAGAQSSNAAGQSPPDQNQIAPGEIADAGTALPDSPGALLRTELRSQLQGDGGAVNIPAGVSDAVLSSSMPVSSEKPGKSAAPLSAKDAQAHQKSDPQKTGEPAPISSPGQAPLPVVLPASAPPPLLVAPELIAAAPSKIQVGQLSTKDHPIASKGAPSQMTDLPGKLAGTASADGAKSDSASKAAFSSAGPGSLNGEAAPVSVDSGSLSQPLPSVPAHGGPASHDGHANSQKMPPAPAVVVPFSATPAMLSSSAAPAPALAHLEQPASGASNGVAAAASGAGSPNLYDRIDQGAAPVVLHSGAQYVSVGVHDPSLGWVEIQTQNTAGHVEATLVTASAQGHDLIATQLPAMAHFLEQRDVRVGMLAVHHELPGSGAGNTGNGTGYGNGGAGAHHSGSENRGDGSRAAPRYTGLSPGGFRPGPGAGARGNDDAASFRPISYISVRA